MLDQFTYRFKDESGCFFRIYKDVLASKVNQQNEKDFAIIYEESSEECEVL